MIRFFPACNSVSINRCKSKSTDGIAPPARAHRTPKPTRQMADRRQIEAADGK
jgi:hypothetical protein